MRIHSLKAEYAFFTVLALSFGLAGCSENDDNKELSVSKNNTMDVKQPEPKVRPLLLLGEPIAARPSPSEPALATPEIARGSLSGKMEYIRCIGCHGVSGEGGVGPRLNNQAPEDIVIKLQRYKEGNRVGPLSSMMIPLVRDMSTEQMHAIAEFITSQ